MNSLAQWLARLEQLHPTPIDLGLERISSVYQRLQLTPQNYKLLTIAGTNGKGTCAAAAEALGLASGASVGCYTSPHLWRYNERIRINGEMASDNDIIAAFSAIEQARQGVSLSYFEFGTLAALWLFDHYQLELWVLEVGLGGRLDAVNVVDCDVAVVTSIGLDHQAWLGNDLDLIAQEKAAICRPGKPLLLGMQVPASAEKLAHAHGALPQRIAPDHQALPLPLEGLHPQSLQLAIKAISCLGYELDGELLARALTGLRVPGRCQRRVVNACEEILDVAHNRAAVEHLAQFVRTLGPAAPTVAVFSALDDKPLEDMVAIMAPLVDVWCIAPLKVPRAASLERIRAALAGQQDVREFASIDQARGHALAHAKRLLSFGSFHTVEQAGQ